MTAAIELLKAVVLLLTFAMQPNVPADLRAQVVIVSNQAIQQATLEIQRSNQLPITTPSMDTTPSPSAPAPAPSAPATPPEATSTPAVPYTEPTISLFANTATEGQTLTVQKGASLRLSWEVKGEEPFHCSATLPEKITVEQNGSQSLVADQSFTFILDCQGARSGTRLTRSIEVVVE